MDEPPVPSEIAYYYPEPYWLADEGSWVKSLLLFFDEIAILLPEYMRGRHVIADPTLAGPIEDLGLLRVIEPETFVDEATAAQLAEVIEALVEGGAFDELGEADRLAELSMSRMGMASLRSVAESVNAKLKERGLAKATEDGVSVPMHPVVRSAYLLVLAQLARETGARHGLDLHPVTNGRGAGTGFRRLLDANVMPSRGQVVDFDLAGKRLSALGGSAGAQERDRDRRRAAQAMIDRAVTEMEPLVGTAPACRALGASRASLYRRRTPPTPRPPRPRTAPPRALSAAEREAVLGELRSERFVDCSLAAVWATLLDEGTYLASQRTMYRLLAQNGEVSERRDQLTHPPYQRPELLAERPNEVWSWDVTKLLGPSKWTYFYLYVILDVFSRYCVGWTVQHRETASVAERLIAETLAKQRIGRDQLTVHADRGPAMRSKPVAFLLADLGVAKSHSRPYTSTDNPYSEAQFKTLKYRPGFPQAVRLDRARPRVLPRVLQLVQPGASTLRDRADDPRDRPPRPRRADPRPARRRPRRRLRRDPRALRAPRAHAAAGTGGGVDQQARQQGERSLNSRPNCLIRLDRLRLPRLVSKATSGAPEDGASAVGRVLWAIRWKLGALLGWDDEDRAPERPTLRDRLPADLRNGPSGPGFEEKPFTPVYLLEDEFAAEIVNRTVHGIMHPRLGRGRGRGRRLARADGCLREPQRAAWARLHGGYQAVPVPAHLPAADARDRARLEGARPRRRVTAISGSEAGAGQLAQPRQRRLQAGTEPRPGQLTGHRVDRRRVRRTGMDIQPNPRHRSGHGRTSSLIWGQPEPSLRPDKPPRGGSGHQPPGTNRHRV